MPSDPVDSEMQSPILKILLHSLHCHIIRDPKKKEGEIFSVKVSLCNGKTMCVVTMRLLAGQCPGQTGLDKFLQSCVDCNLAQAGLGIKSYKVQSETVDTRQSPGTR